MAVKPERLAELKLKAKLVKEHMDQKNPPYGRAFVS